MQIDRRRFVNGALGGGAAAAMAAWFPAWAQSGSTGIIAPAADRFGQRHHAAHRTPDDDDRRQAQPRDRHQRHRAGAADPPARRARRSRLTRRSTISTRTARSTGMACWCRSRWTACPASAFPASSRARPSPMNFRSSRRAPIGITAIRGFRSSSAIMARSSSILPGADPIAYDREHVVVLSDHSELSPDSDLPQAQACSPAISMPAADAGGPARRQGPAAQGARRMGRRCGWTRPTSPTSPDRPTPISSTATARATTGPRCSRPASGCGCASSTPRR